MTVRTDVVAANLAAARVGELPHSVYNIGTGTEISVLELAEVVALAAGIDPVRFAPEFAPARLGELIRSCLDVTRARHELGLPPVHAAARGPDTHPESAARTVTDLQRVNGVVD